MLLKPRTYPLKAEELSGDGSMGDVLSKFFVDKGFAKLKNEDKTQKFYWDFLEFQAQHQMYYKLLDFKSFEPLKIARFAERFAFYSSSNAYSFQVSLLGIIPFWMSKNEKMIEEASRTLKGGGVLAFGLSEKEHGADVYSSEFVLKKNGIASGSKYYIGNTNCASLISILGRREENPRTTSKEPFVFMAYRPKENPTFKNVKKIETMGVRSAFVGAFEVENQKIEPSDILSEGVHAWDTIFGTVNLGKFMLGFGSIGISERAFQEAKKHTSQRILFGKSVFSMPHIQDTFEQAYVKLYGMKLFAYRAVDYLTAANEQDRRYLLFNSVQKAKVTTEGVSILNLLTEVMGAKGFEADQFFENALREIVLIPNLEGSTHINFGLVAQFMKNYLFNHDSSLQQPAHLQSELPNPYLFEAKTGGFKKVRFPNYEKSFRPFGKLDNVSTFLSQISAFKRFLMFLGLQKQTDPVIFLSLGKVFANIPYAQLICEKAEEDKTPNEIVDLIFSQIIESFSHAIVTTISIPSLNPVQRFLLRRCISTHYTTPKQWEVVEGMI